MGDSLIYNRTISIERGVPNGTAGDTGYAGITKTRITPVFTDISASIQDRLTNIGRAPMGLPSDGFKSPWKINFLLPDQTNKTAVRDRDTIIDDAGIRYQISSARWSVLNWQCLCEQLKG